MAVADKVLYSPPQNGSSNMALGGNAFHPWRKVDGMPPTPDFTSEVAWSMTQTRGAPDDAIRAAWEQAELFARNLARNSFSQEEVDARAWALVIWQTIIPDGAGNYIASIVWVYSVNDVSGNTNPGQLLGF